MARQIPDSFFPLRLSQGASGQPDRLHVTRSLGQNAHFLYGQKVMEGGWFANTWNANNSRTVAANSVSYSQVDPLLLARFYVPPALSGNRVLSLLVSWSGTRTAARIRIEGAGQEWTFDLPTMITTPITWTVPEPTSYTISLVGSGSGGGSVSVVSLGAYYGQGTYDGRTPTWQPLAQGYADQAFPPDSSYLYRKLIDNEATILTEPSGMLWNRSFLVPWTNSATATVVADYQVVVAPRVHQARVAFYARMLDPNVSGTVRVRVNGVDRLTQAIGANMGWDLYGQYQGLAVPVTSGTVNRIQILANKSSGGGTGLGLEVAGVYLWEDTPDQGAICAGDDPIPGDYAGLDSDAMTGIQTIYADRDSQDRRVGKGCLLSDLPWLMAYRRRMLINDWIHRVSMYPAGEAARPYANGVRGDTFGMAGEPPKEWARIPAGEDGGTLIGLAALPPPAWSPGFTEAEVWVAVSSYARRYSTAATDDGGNRYTLEPYEDPWVIRVTGAGVVETRTVPALMEPRAEARERMAESEETYWQTYNVGQNLQDWISSPGGPPIAWVGPFTVGIEPGNVTPIYVEAARERARYDGFLTCHGVYVGHKPIAGAI